VVNITYLRDFLHGTIMGLTSTIPGVSFGTVAIVLNIYEKILTAMSLTNLKKNSGFLIPLGVGCVCGVLLFSKLVTYLLLEHEMVTYFCFIGMIVGCVPMIYRRIKCDKIKFSSIAAFVLSLAFMTYLAVLNYGSQSNQTLEQMGGITSSLLVWIFFAGFISAMTMIIPGISGAVIMLMLGAYTVSVEAVSTFNVVIIATVGAGILLGCLAGIKLVKVILGLYPQELYSAVLGLILGSILIIYPGFTAGPEGIESIVLAILFAVFIYLFSKKN